MRGKLESRKKLNSKGFSLIELIIVIAIMAVLIGIVGMQLMPYIQKSKEAKDKQVLSGILTNATSAFASCAESCEIGTNNQVITVTCSTGAIAASGTFAGSDNVVSALEDLTKFNGKVPMTSKKGTEIATITITRDADGKVAISVDKNADVFPIISST